MQTKANHQRLGDEDSASRLVSARLAASPDSDAAGPEAEHESVVFLVDFFNLNRVLLEFAHIKKSSVRFDLFLSMNNFLGQSPHSIDSANGLKLFALVRNKSAFARQISTFIVFCFFLFLSEPQSWQKSLLMAEEKNLLIIEFVFSESMNECLRTSFEDQSKAHLQVCFHLCSVFSAFFDKVDQKNPDLLSKETRQNLQEIRILNSIFLSQLEPDRSIGPGDSLASFKSQMVHILVQAFKGGPNRRKQ